MLRHRLLTGSTLVALFVLAVFVDEKWLAPWFPCWLVICVAFQSRAAIEISGLLSATSARPSVNAVLGGVVATTLANWLPHLIRLALVHWHKSRDIAYQQGAPFDVMAWPFWAFIGVLMAAFLAQGVQFNRPGRTMATLSGTILAISYVGLLGSFVIQMRWFSGPIHGVIPLAMLVATAKGADVGAYTLGRIAGRHKLWPKLSPKKTVEGAAGGIILGTLAALAVNLVGRLLHVPALGWPQCLGFGLLVSIAAQLGDLMESMIKRDCDRKDASDALPGFGGVLDVMDSLLFAGPVAYAYWLALGP
jgi:phosphatidate cytidylyltransferase